MAFASRFAVLHRVISLNRHLVTTSFVQAGGKVRIRQGFAADGLSYGPLTDLPDWSYADGRPAPETKQRRSRQLKRLDVAERIHRLMAEVDEAVKRDARESTNTPHYKNKSR